MIDRSQIHQGMRVRGSDGKNMGRVLDCEEASFLVEKGFFFVIDYTTRYDDVAAISGEEIKVSRPRGEVAHAARVFPHEGGLGEIVTLGMAGYILPAQLSVRGEKDGTGLRRNMNEPAKYSVTERPSADAPTYGDEGGGGLL